MIIICFFKWIWNGIKAEIKRDQEMLDNETPEERLERW
jgi:hypothetical protein